MSSRPRLAHGFLLTTLGAILGSAVAGGPVRAQEVKLLFTYGSEKEGWLKEVTESFNAKQVKLPDGTRIHVDLKAMGSGQCIDSVLNDDLKPHLTSPASSVWVNVANTRWQSRPGAEDARVIGKTRSLVRSPVVIAMWDEMVDAVGWEKGDVGWCELADLIRDLAANPEKYPKWKKEWGAFKFAHTHPELSNSGMQGVLAMTLARMDRTGALKVSDLAKPEVQRVLKDIQESVAFYGQSTGFLGTSMGERGPNGISATILYESEVIKLNSRPGAKNRVRAIYPVDGTFYSDHPVGVVSREWVTKKHKEAAEVYIKYLLEDEQQAVAAKTGFRPGNPGLNVTGEKFTERFGVDPSKPDPRHVREAPEADVVEAIIKLWSQERKGSQIILAIDISGSMRDYGKIERAKEWARALVHDLEDKNSLSLITFNHKVVQVQKSLPLNDENKAIMLKLVDGLRPEGATRLYDAIGVACHQLAQEAAADSKKSIQTIILLSDGRDTRSKMTEEDLFQQLKGPGSHIPVIFTIAYDIPGQKEPPKPDDVERPDMVFLRELAKLSGGSVYAADPEKIKTALAEINSFFKRQVVDSK